MKCSAVRPWLYWGTCAVLVLLAGLRYRMGVDTEYYEIGYRAIAPLSGFLHQNPAEVRNFEPGYLFFLSLMKSLGCGIVVVQMVQACFVNVVIFRFFRRESKRSFLCVGVYVLLYYLFFSMEVVRQSIAVAIVILGWPSLVKGKRLTYGFFCLAAGLFHFSALAALLLIPISCNSGWVAKWSRRLLTPGIQTLPVCCVVMLVAFVTDLFFLDIFRPLAITETVKIKIEAYAGFTEGGQVYNWKGMIGYYLRMVALPLIGVALCREVNNTRWRLITASVLLMTYFISAAFPMAIMMRLAYVFAIFTLPAFSKVPDAISSLLIILAYKRRMRWYMVISSVLWSGWIAIVLYPWFQPMGFDPSKKSYMIYFPISTHIDKIKDAEREALLEYYLKRE